MFPGPFLCLSTESVTEVRTNIYVTSFGPVSDTDMVSIILFILLLTLIITMSHQIWESYQTVFLYSAKI